MEAKVASEVQQGLDRFLAALHSPERLSRSLRKMMMEHMMYERGGQSLYFYEMLEDFHTLFELLDTAQDNWQLEKRGSGRESTSPQKK